MCVCVYLLGPKCKPLDRHLMCFYAELTGIKCSSAEMRVNPGRELILKAMTYIFGFGWFLPILFHFIPGDILAAFYT